MGVGVWGSVVVGTSATVNSADSMSSLVTAIPVIRSASAKLASR